MTEHFGWGRVLDYTRAHDGTDLVVIDAEARRALYDLGWREAFPPAAAYAGGTIAPVWVGVFVSVLAYAVEHGRDAGVDWRRALAALRADGELRAALEALFHLTCHGNFRLAGGMPGVRLKRFLATHFPGLQRAPRC